MCHKILHTYAQSQEMLSFFLSKLVEGIFFWYCDTKILKMKPLFRNTVQNCSEFVTIFWYNNTQLVQKPNITL